MYKKRINDWNLNKNHREKNIRAIIRKQTQRSAVGKSSSFTLYGRPVDLTDVQRHLKRKGLKAEDVVSSRSATPVELLCFTPKIETRSEYELLSSSRSHLATPVEAPMELG